jgi:hypothetical protein
MLVVTVIALRLVPVFYRHRCPDLKIVKRESRHKIKPRGEAPRSSRAGGTMRAKLPFRSE